jgi:hypothetical protein
MVCYLRLTYWQFEIQRTWNSTSSLWGKKWTSHVNLPIFVLFVYIFLLLESDVNENIYSDSSSSGLTYVGGVLKHKGHRVTSTTASDGLRNIIKFLTQFPNIIPFKILIFHFFYSSCEGISLWRTLRMQYKGVLIH